MRLLGLARGFRLYDKIAGTYLPRKAALQAVRQAMEKALEIYADVDCGQPFVDLVTRPWGNARLFWFDGGSRRPTAEEVGSLLANETLAVMQIALRPVPDGLKACLRNGEKAARYYGFSLEPNAGKGGTAEVELDLKEDGPAAAVDVLPAHSGLESVRPVRLTRQAPRIALVTSTTLPKERDVAIVRIASFARDDVRPEHVLKVLIGGREVPAGRFREIDKPVALREDDLEPDTAFGKFEALADEDWAGALFRPVAADLRPLEAFARLSGYLGRRFGRLTVPADETRTSLAGRIVRFWAPFLEHCAAPPDEVPAGDRPPPVFFSLGTIAEPGLWQQAPDEHGKLSILIPETDRRGKRRKFAVRPVGRYQNWAEASPWMAVDGTFARTVLPSGLSGAFDTGEWLRRFADVTIPRTEPLDKPVILATRRTRPDRGRTAAGASSW